MSLTSERTKAGLAGVRLGSGRLGRRPTQIPVDVVREYLQLGLTKKAIYRMLVKQGLLRYQEKGVVKILSYNQFLQRLKTLGL